MMSRAERRQSSSGRGVGRVCLLHHNNVSGAKQTVETSTLGGGSPRVDREEGPRIPSRHPNVAVKWKVGSGGRGWRGGRRGQWRGLRRRKGREVIRGRRVERASEGERVGREGVQRDHSTPGVGADAARRAVSWSGRGSRMAGRLGRRRGRGGGGKRINMRGDMQTTLTPLREHPLAT